MTSSRGNPIEHISLTAFSRADPVTKPVEPKPDPVSADGAASVEAGAAVEACSDGAAAGASGAAPGLASSDAAGFVGVAAAAAGVIFTSLPLADGAAVAGAGLGCVALRD